MPVARGRVAELDALRGFALLGILLMNSEFFARPLQGLALGFDPRWQGADRLAGLFVATFVQGKFWLLFALLFGAGFAALLERAGERFDAVFARRLAALLAIGLLHAALLWAGDILVTYALAGFALWLATRVLPPALWARAGLLAWALPLAMMWLSVAAMGIAPGDELARLAAEHTRGLQVAHDAAARVYAEGGWLEVTRQRIEDSLTQYSWLASTLPSVLGMFLLGAWAWQAGWLRDPRAERALWGRLAWVSLPVGAALAVIGEAAVLANDPSVLTPALARAVTLQSLGSLVSCVAYGAGFLWLATRPGTPLVAWLAPAGRMSLSNYLAQSLVFSTIFYGYGLGAWGNVGRAAQLGLALLFFLLQLAGSRAWLAHFALGPAEAAWRAATWLRRPALRR